MIRKSWIVWAMLVAAPAAAQTDTARTDFISSAGVRMGIWSAETLDETVVDSNLSRIRTASDLFLSFQIVRRVTDFLAAEVSFGGLSRGDALIREGGLAVRRATISIYPLSLGFRFYPLAPNGKRRIMGYLSGAGSLVLGVQTFKESNSQYAYSFNYSSETDVTLGGAVGAGLDYKLGERFYLGLYGGYQQAKFSKPLSDLPGGVTDFSGPQFTITFSYLIAGAHEGPRGEGRYGN